MNGAMQRKFPKLSALSIFGFIAGRVGGLGLRPGISAKNGKVMKSCWILFRSLKYTKAVSMNKSHLQDKESLVNRQM